MSATNPKNDGLDPMKAAGAIMDLGLGAQLVAQAQAMESERKKKSASFAPQSPMMGGAVQSLFGGQ